MISARSTGCDALASVSAEERWREDFAGNILHNFFPTDRTSRSRRRPSAKSVPSKELLVPSRVSSQCTQDACSTQTAGQDYRPTKKRPPKVYAILRSLRRHYTSRLFITGQMRESQRSQRLSTRQMMTARRKSSSRRVRTQVVSLGFL